MVHSRCHTCITFYLNLCWWRLDFELLVTYHSTFVIYLHSYTVFKPLVVMFFRTYVVSAPRCILCEKRLRFKPKYIHFVYSYVVYVAFPSCLRRQVLVCCFSKSSVFSTRGARGHAVVMVTNDPFSDHFRFFFGSEQPRSQSSLAISDRTSPVKLVGKIRTIALGSKPPLVTRIARTGLGTRLVEESISSEITNPFLDSPAAF